MPWMTFSMTWMVRRYEGKWEREPITSSSIHLTYSSIHISTLCHPSNHPIHRTHRTLAWNIDKMSEFKQDAMVKQSFESGVDLREYAKTIDETLQAIEEEHIMDCTCGWRILELYLSITNFNPNLPSPLPPPPHRHPQHSCTGGPAWGDPGKASGHTHFGRRIDHSSG